MHIRSMPSSRAVGVLLTLTMALAMVMFSAPDARAHGDHGDHDHFVFTPFVSNNGDGVPLVPVCIETAFAQAQDESLKVGNTFMDKGVVYMITTGAGSCHFNCYNGWDINCDGKLGDFCAIEYDLTEVGDVAKCLADRGLSPIG